MCKLPATAPLEPWLAALRDTMVQRQSSNPAPEDQPTQQLRSITLTGDEISIVWDAESAVTLLKASLDAGFQNGVIQDAVIQNAVVPKESTSVAKTPANLELGWNCFRIAGSMPFELVGVVSAITSVLASAKISVFVVSTYDTDYILIKSDDRDAAIACCQSAGYTVASEPFRP